MKRSFKDLSAAEVLALAISLEEEDTHRHPHRQFVSCSSSAGMSGVAPCWLHT
jgi:hypothetical protein